MEDPFDPDKFGDIFAGTLSKIADPDTEVDGVSDVHAFECIVTVQGVDHKVRIIPQALDDLN